MTKKAENSWTEHAEEVANHQYDASDYSDTSETARGIAETHEQASDVYTAGTSDGTLIRNKQDTAE